MDIIEQIIGWLNKLQGAPAVALVFLGCLAIGYALRFIQRFPNGGIPVVVILCGGMFMMLIADSRASTMSLRVWVVRNLVIGLVIGFVAWLTHNLILSRIEDWATSKFPSKPSDKPDDRLTEPPPGPKTGS